MLQAIDTGRWLPTAGIVSLLTLYLSACTAESGITTQNNLDDALLPPAEPALSITAEPGSLVFQWTPVASQSVARLYRHDTLTGTETLVLETDDPQAAWHRLPSETPTTTWYAQQFRIELCTVDDCVSSQRLTTGGLAADTTTMLRPAVFFSGERYAEHLALNHDASLSVSSLPVEGALEFHQRIGNDWHPAQRYRLPGLVQSTTRTLKPALSATGDTLAVLLQDSAMIDRPEIRILERLGEAWLETHRWLVDGPAIDDDSTITLADDGNRLLLQSRDIVITRERLATGWSEATTAITVDALGGERLLASSADKTLTRLFTLAVRNDALYLDIRHWSEVDAGWQSAGSVSLSGFSLSDDLDIHSHASGESILIAGWEDSGIDTRTPIVWQYDVLNPTGSSSQVDSAVTSVASLRGAPTSQPAAELIFRASESLATLALGWQSPYRASALSTYVLQPQGQHWQPALELPEDIPVLAKQAFAGEVVLSGDGHTLMIGSRAGQTLSSGNRVGEVLVLY